MSARRPEIAGALCGVTAAMTFGASAPVSKLLLPAIPPLLLAGLLYLGAGLALSAFMLVRPERHRAREARISRRDVGILLGITVTGGIAGPVLMLVGLERVSGLAGSLLLNLEAPFTILLAVLVFGEHLGRRATLAAIAIVSGGVLLSWQPGEMAAQLGGVAAIAGGCLAWGIDNNLTQRLSLKDPVAVVRWKTLGAGACTVSIALAVGVDVPDLRVAGGAMALGVVAYGLSILLDMYALRLLGAAREAAFFATAPFMGAVLALPLLGDRVGLGEAGAAVLMASGVWLLLRDRHGHLHTHAPMEHDHMHVHDEHHQHQHDGPFSEPHAHVHRHEALTHDHPHVSDLHHRHRHGRSDG